MRVTAGLLAALLCLLISCAQGPPAGSVPITDCPVAGLSMPPGSDVSKTLEMPNYWSFSGMVPTDESGFTKHLEAVARANGMKRLKQLDKDHSRGIAYESANKRFMMVFTYMGGPGGGVVMLSITPR